VRNVLRLRRKRSVAERVKRHGRELVKTAPQLDIPWVRSWPAARVRESFLSFVLGPIIVYYTRRRATGREKLAGIRGPAILVANHRSHMDTPVILGALPRRLRRRTVVGAAADYFYGNRLLALLVSLVFNTVPVDRCGGGLDKRAAGHLDRLLDDGWSLLMYPEGTRSRDGGTGRVRRGAAVLAARHGAPIVPIRVSGTRDAMPPGRFWPRRRHERLVPTRHKVDIVIGDPIAPSEDSSSVIQAVQRFFDGGEMNGNEPPRSRRFSIGRSSEHDPAKT
jgi:1-acyl-sn-glycerol-3-phosphate acyltransferase